MPVARPNRAPEPLGPPGTRLLIPARWRWTRLILAPWLTAPLLLLVPASATSANAQSNYEIQVYASELMARRHTMFEFHSNFTPIGEKNPTDGTQPTDHAFHETFEITHGFTNWLEVGFYIFTSARAGDGWDFVGSHIRPRLTVPERWGWPVGVSLSQEIGYQRRYFSPDTWTWEIRPIIDKQMGPLYWAVNLAFEKSLEGENAHKTFEFSPAAKVSYDVGRAVALGVEYYGGLGPVTEFDPPPDQQHQIFPSIDLKVSPDWEVNFGVGVGLTRSTDGLLIKLIIGRRVAF
jgi:hypothetical protein